MRAATESYLESVRTGGNDLIETGISDLDYAIGGGVERGEMMVICARPSHGKTAVALQMLHNATAFGMPCLMISEEMSALALGKRTIQFASSVPQEHWPTSLGHLEDDMTSHFKHRAELFVAESAGTSERACDVIREHVEKHKVSMVAIDYAQLLSSEGKGRYEQTTATSMALRKIATESNIVLIVLAQLNRTVEGEKVFMPRPSHIKDTGQFEQDADTIIAGCWPHRLDSSRDPKEYMFFVMKNRNRPINTPAVKCQFLPSRQMITMPPIELRQNYNEGLARFGKDEF
jgi:replicative DNA helicase